ncbi:MAG: hypothetical protein ABSC41_19840 [Acidimicrobiales bacterium]|jgi:hypothetical protein
MSDLDDEMAALDGEVELLSSQLPTAMERVFDATVQFSSDCFDAMLVTAHRQAHRRRAKRESSQAGELWDTA